MEPLPAPTKRQIHNFAHALADGLGLTVVVHHTYDVLRLAEREREHVVALVQPYRRKISSWSWAEPGGIELSLANVTDSRSHRTIVRRGRVVLDPRKPIPGKVKTRLGELVEMHREQLALRDARSAANEKREKMNTETGDERIQIFDTDTLGEYELGVSFAAPISALPHVRAALALFDQLTKEKT